MKLCSKCKELKPLEEFASNKSNKDGLQYSCKVCQRRYVKGHYDKNVQYYVEKAARRRIELRIEFYQWLQTQKCVDCGNDDFRVLEFDHLKDKDFNIAEKIGRVSLDVLMKEIDKCDIVCANCHRIRTTIRDSQYKYLALLA